MDFDLTIPRKPLHFATTKTPTSRPISLPNHTTQRTQIEQILQTVCKPSLFLMKEQKENP